MALPGPIISFATAINAGEAERVDRHRRVCDARRRGVAERRRSGDGVSKRQDVASGSTCTSWPASSRSAALT